MNKNMLIFIGAGLAGYFLADTICNLPVVGGVATTVRGIGAKI